jgi:2-polyprenyl-3-methyl-5-hydroxy-6-metoxy-1,4-benzoquinol methylase
MQKDHLQYLRCPTTGNTLSVENAVLESGRIKSGTLLDASGEHRYPIVGFIPRFVSPDNYCKSFSIEWKHHCKTLHQTYSGHDFVRTRYYKETRWGSDLKGELLLELGCGSGCLTTHALETGAMVVSFDYSTGVEANYAANGQHPNLLIVQANIFQMPFPKRLFDKAYCFGVLQHTPDPKAALMAMVQMVKPGGKLASDIYAYDPRDGMLRSKYLLRPLATKMSPETLYNLVYWYVNCTWWFSRLVEKIPRIGWRINRNLLLDHHFCQQMPGASQQYLKEVNYQNIFDLLSPAYDYPQTLETFKAWHTEAGLKDIDVCRGYNGIEGHASVAVQINSNHLPGPQNPTISKAA